MTARTWLCILVAAALGREACGADGPAAPGREKQFAAVEYWSPLHPAGTALKLSSADVEGSAVLRMDFDLGTGKLYVVAARPFAASLPAEYEMSFRVKGTGPRNNLEFKLVDDRGNTFQRVWRGFRFTGDWQTLTVPRKDIRFGWGLSPTNRLERITRIEFALSGGEGGAGSLLLDDFQLRELPAGPPEPVLNAVASSEENKDGAARFAVDGIYSTRWWSKPFDPQWIQIDLGGRRKLAGLGLVWGNHGDYEVQLSDDGKTWRTVYVQEEADGGRDDIYFAETAARRVKILTRRQAVRDGYNLFEVELKGPEEGVLVTASAESEDAPAGQAMDGSMNTEWHSDHDGTPWLAVDLRGEKVCGGLVIHWGEDYAKSYVVEASGNGLNWYPVYKATDQKGGTDRIFLEETEARCLRIVCRESGTGKGFSIREIELKSADDRMTVTKFYQVAARRNPGCYPRWLLNEQAYWTIVGTPEDVSEGALCEDGTIEPHKRGFTIMPLLRVGGKLVTRNEAEVTQALRDDCLPVPSVTWRHDGLKMVTELFAHGGAESSIYGSFTLANEGGEALPVELFLAVRPIQVYPPWQAGTDGFSPIRSIAYADGVVRLDSNRTVHLLTKPDRFAAKGGTFQVGQPVEGDIGDDIARGTLPDAVSAEDTNGFASGAASYSFTLAPGETREVFLAVPLHETPPALAAGVEEAGVKARIGAMLDETLAYWRAQVERIKITVPDAAFLNTLKANVAYNLITKDGPGFQPGSRSYDKAWMRDGGSAAEALLKMGLTREIREFIDWFGAYQFESGEVPPIIDNKHEDPLWEEKQGLHEYDSQGEFVHLILEYYHFTGDREFLREKFPQVVKALEFLSALRQQRCSPEYADGPIERRVFYNILLPSRSHEGYWLAHSYWDNFWGLRGWTAGRQIAEILGEDERAAWMGREYGELKRGVYDSIALVMKLRHIDYIPGCAELGDFDATSTAAALVYCGELENMPQPQLSNTFNRFFNDLTDRFEPGAKFVFTPYEMRTVLAFLFMGEKDRALKLLHFMVGCRRPLAWNHLAEVVHSGYRFPCYIGDMPHTWVGAEYINAARGLFVYEKGKTLILGAGIDPKWLEGGERVAIDSLPTHFGNISYEMRKADGTVSVRVSGEAAPAGGIVFKSPLAAAPREIKVNGVAVDAAGGDVRLSGLPADIEFVY